MKLFFEIVMLVSFCSALIVMIVRFAKQKSTRVLFDRITVIIIGIGFLLGGAIKILMNTADWVIIFYVFGVHLSYTATLFSFQKFEEGGEVIE